MRYDRLVENKVNPRVTQPPNKVSISWQTLLATSNVSPRNEPTCFGRSSNGFSHRTSLAQCNKRDFRPSRGLQLRGARSEWVWVRDDRLLAYDKADNRLHSF